MRGVNGRPATMSLCLGVTATFPASASRCLGVEGVRNGFSGSATCAFAGEFSVAVERGSRDPGAPCFAGAVRAFFPRFADGFSSASSTSTSIASTLRTFFLFGVTNGFSISASSRMTNCARRFDRVETASAYRVRYVSTRKVRPECLPVASAVAELRVLFPRTVEAIVRVCRRYNGWYVVWKARRGGVTKMRKESAADTRLNQARPRKVESAVVGAPTSPSAIFHVLPPFTF